MKSTKVAEVVEEEEVEERYYEIWAWSSIERKWTMDTIWSYKDDLAPQAQEFTFDLASGDNGCDDTKWVAHKVDGAIIFSGGGSFEDEDYDTGRIFDRDFKAVAVVNVDLPPRKFSALRKMVQALVKAGSFVPKR